MKKLILIALLTVATTACAHRGKPIIDTKGIDMATYRQDLFECNQYAQQVNSKAGKGAVGGAVVGAAVGGIVGNSKTAQKGAAVGALSGMLKGSARTKAEKSTVVKNCLSQRGYKVLN